VLLLAGSPCVSRITRLGLAQQPELTDKAIMALQSFSALRELNLSFCVTHHQYSQLYPQHLLQPTPLGGWASITPLAPHAPISRPQQTSHSPPQHPPSNQSTLQQILLQRLNQSKPPPHPASPSLTISRSPNSPLLTTQQLLQQRLQQRIQQRTDIEPTSQSNIEGTLNEMDVQPDASDTSSEMGSDEMKSDTPQTNAPQADSPKTDTPNTPQTDMPQTDLLKTDDLPDTDIPTSDLQKAEQQILKQDTTITESTTTATEPNTSDKQISVVNSEHKNEPATNVGEKDADVMMEESTTPPTPTATVSTAPVPPNPNVTLTSNAPTHLTSSSSSNPSTPVSVPAHPFQQPLITAEAILAASTGWPVMETLYLDGIRFSPRMVNQV
jgi:hypothetical protein